MTVHGLMLSAAILVPLMAANDKLPVVPTMMAFVASPVAPPPPPPPPLPKAAARAPEAKPLPTNPSNPNAAPIEAPAEIRPEPAFAGSDDDFGVEGGVEGGVAGGTLGGIVGGLVDALPPLRRRPRRSSPYRSSQCESVVKSTRRSCCAASSPSIPRSRSWPRSPGP